MNNTGYVYFVGMEGTNLVKIGCAKAPERRLASLQTGLPYKLELLYQAEVSNPRTVEHSLHTILQDRRVRGEWFEMPETPIPDLIAQAETFIPVRAERRPRQNSNATVQSVALGRRVAGKRVELDWTQKDLARRVACSRATINSLELAKTLITPANLHAVARALGVSMDYLMGETRDSAPCGVG